MVNVGGIVIPPFDVMRLSITPPAGATVVSVTVPVAFCPPFTEPGLIVKALRFGDVFAGFGEPQAPKPASSKNSRP
jgi:hypothetical protein